MSAGMRRYEDLAVGEVIESAAVTITEAHVVAFAGLTGDFHPLHMDEVHARATPFKARIAHGPLVFSIGTGLFSRADPLDSIAFLGMEWRLLKPVFFGDTIHVRSTLVDTRVTSSGDRAIVEHMREVRNQREEVVQSGTTKIMMLVRN
jgi:acyl dehydratase